MILAFDTYYTENRAKTVCVTFADWSDDSISDFFSEIKENVEEYQPGEFYRRELPCILSLLQKMNLNQNDIECIIVDGYVFLDDNNRLGLGGHLYKALGEKIPIVGVAKTNFASIVENKRSLLRGKSSNPLFVTAVGLDLDVATRNIERMSGAYRFPALLKELDRLTRLE